MKFSYIFNFIILNLLKLIEGQKNIKERARPLSVLQQLSKIEYYLCMFLLNESISSHISICQIEN